jgi:hypothetical protein
MAAEPRDDTGLLADRLSEEGYPEQHVHHVEDGLPPEHRRIPRDLLDALNSLEVGGLKAVSKVNRHLERTGHRGGDFMQFPV